MASSNRGRFPFSYVRHALISLVHTGAFWRFCRKICLWQWLHWKPIPRFIGFGIIEDGVSRIYQTYQNPTHMITPGKRRLGIGSYLSSRKCWIQTQEIVCFWSAAFIMFILQLWLVHAWDYRRYILANMPIPRPPASELAYTSRKIESNFSNFSAWHQRSKVLSSLWESGDLDESKSKEKGKHAWTLFCILQIVTFGGQSLNLSVMRCIQTQTTKVCGCTTGGLLGQVRAVF